MTTPRELDTFTRQPPAGRISFEQFLEWCDEDTLAEWVGGEVQLMSPTSRRDQRLLLFLLSVLGLWIEEKHLGELHSETFLMRLSGPAGSGRV